MENKFIADNILQYCIENSSELSKSTIDIYSESIKRENGYKVIGLLPGYFLRSLILAKKALKILEIGTFTGYTLSLFYEYSNLDANITSIEEDKEMYDLTRVKFCAELETGRVNLINDEGINYLENTPKVFDFIFIDARKESYFDKIDLLHEKLESNGVLIVDNALAGLSVFDPIKPWQKQTVDFNKHLALDQRFVTMILPLRDGFTISIKK